MEIDETLLVELKDCKTVLDKIADCKYPKIDFSVREKKLLSRLRDDLNILFTQ